MTLAEKLLQTHTRYEEEQCNISGYLTAVSEHACFSRHELDTLNATLAAVGLTPIPFNGKLNLTPSDTCALIEPIREAGRNALAMFQQGVGTEPPLPPYPSSEAAGEHRRSFFIVFDLLKQLAFRTQPDDKIRELFITLYSHLSPLKEHTTPELMTELADYAVEMMRHHLYHQRLGHFAWLLTEPGKMITRARSVLPTAETNIHRQTFLLLVMAFDAAVFDLMRIALQADFFGLIGKVSKEKFSLAEIAEYGSFEAFRDQVIDKHLKELYIKGLLDHLANKLSVSLTDDPSNLPKLIEPMLRRNIHVHNRGIVDQRFLDDGCNPYGLKIGNYAGFDVSYWYTTAHFLSTAVKKLVVWVRGLIEKCEGKAE
jgi:hypothetical protein